MWQDSRPVYTPRMKYRTHFLPVRTWIALAVASVLIVLWGAQGIRGYFWLIAHIGEGIMKGLQWAHVIAR